MILGLDISTSITGYTLLENDGTLNKIGHIDLRKEKNFFKKARLVEDTLRGIDKESVSWVQRVYIEQSLQSFRSGFSSAQTLSLLSRFNGVVSWLCYDVYNLEPQFLAATSARKTAGIKVPRGKKAKEVVLQFTIDNLAGFDVQYTRHGNPKAGYTDQADSYVIARAGWLNERAKAKDTD